jgi:hypothetical protein
MTRQKEKLKVVREDLEGLKLNKNKDTFFKEFTDTFGKYKRYIKFKQIFKDYYEVKEGLFSIIAKVHFYPDWTKEEVDVLVVTTPNNFDLIKVICEKDKSDFKIILKCKDEI